MSNNTTVNFSGCGIAIIGLLVAAASLVLLILKFTAYPEITYFQVFVPIIFAIASIVLFYVIVVVGTLLIGALTVGTAALFVGLGKLWRRFNRIPRVAAWQERRRLNKRKAMLEKMSARLGSRRAAHVQATLKELEERMN
jgi:hypothetical protein